MQGVDRRPLLCQWVYLRCASVAGSAGGEQAVLELFQPSPTGNIYGRGFMC